MAGSLRQSLFQRLTGKHEQPISVEVSSFSRPKGSNHVWCHATTITQAAAFVELVQRLSEDLFDVAYTITTPSEDVISHMEEMLPSEVSVRLLAQDEPEVAKILNPDVVIWTNPSRFSATIEQLSKQKAKVYLTDATIPARRPMSMRLPGAQRKLLGHFDQILATESKVGHWLSYYGIGASKVDILGEMQEGSVALHCNEAERDTLAELLAARPVWLAARCTKEEEEIVRDAHRRALRASHRLLLFFVPEHPSDGAEIASRFEMNNFSTAIRSDGSEPEEDLQVYVADTEGEMGLWYRLAPISFLGGSLGSGHGSVNPYKAAALGSAILFGPNTGQHTAAFQRLSSAGAANIVRNENELGLAVQSLLSPDKAAQMAHSAWVVTSGGSQIIDRLAELVTAALNEAGAF